MIETLYRAVCDNCNAWLSDNNYEDAFEDEDKLKELMVKYGWVEDSDGLWCNECKGLPFTEEEDD
jgi:hypothetical protein